MGPHHEACAALTARAARCRSAVELEALLPALVGLIDEGRLQACLKEALERLSTDASYALPHLGNTNSWVAAWHEEASLRLLAITAPHDPATRPRGFAEHRLWRVLQGGVTLGRWRHAGGEPTRLDAKERLVPGPARALRPGEAIVIEAWRDVVEIAGHEPGTLLVELSSSPVVSQRWIYDRR